MALVIKDRVKETTTTTGTGTYTLAGAVSGFETFTANLSNSDTTYYVCTDNTDFEVGLGTFTSSGTTLARTTILASSNSNNEVNWSSGTRSIFMTYPADKAVFEDASGHVSIPHDLFIAGGLIDLKNDGGAVSQIKFYCESSNAHAQTLIGAPHSESASNTLTLPSSGGNAKLLSATSTATLTNKSIDSDNNTITNIVNADIKSSAAIADTKLDTISTAGKVAISALDIDGGTDIGAALVDADEIIVDDGGGGTNRRSDMSRVKTYVADVTLTTAAQTNITSLGTLTALTVDDVAIDGKVVTLTGSASDTATLTAGTNGTLDIVTTDAGGASANIQITADGTAELAGTTVTLDSSGGITLDADGGTITFADAGSSLGTITSSGYSGNSATASAVAAANLTGDTLASGVTASSLTSVGTLASLTTSGDITVGDDLTVNGGVIDLKTNSGSVAQLKFYCESGNAHAQTLQAQPHSASASDVLTLPTGGNSTLVSRISTDTLTNKTLTSPKINENVALTSTATELNLLDGITGIADEDDLTSDSNTKLATQQSIKAYVDAQKADMQFVLEDGDGTEVQITKDKEVKFVEGGGLDINWTDVSTGSDGDPYDLTFTINAAQTDITSVVNTSLEIGRDADNRIKFGTDNQIIFEVSGGDNVIFKASGEIEATSLDIGSGGADIDGTLEANAITIGGTALNTVIAGVTVTNATTAAVATTVTITDNESTNEDNAIIFTAGGDVDGGNIGLESDGTLTYNPSTGKITATGFIGALTGNADTATALATGRTIGMTGDVVWTSASFTGAGNVTGTATIQAGAVENSMLADDAVGADELAANAVVNASVASGAAIAFSKMADLTASRALVSDGSGDVSVSAVTSTEIGYLDGVTSAIQTQLDAKATKGFATAMAIAL